MYGWTDPIDPEGAPRRHEPPMDEPPAWLTDRPEPRSSYLFGDESQPSDDAWHRDQPQPSDDAWHRDQPTEQWQPAPAAGSAPYPATIGPDQTMITPQPVDLTAYRAARVEDAPAGGEGRHRSPSRFPRPLLIGGAAAAATLLVSLGVGALVLPGGGEQDPTAVNDTVAAAPALPEDGTTPADALDAASPTASPTTARPTPSPSRTVKPTPAPSRTTAPSRKSVERSGGTTARATRTAAGSGTVSSQAQEVVDLVNAERAKAGCGALKINDKLMLAAQRHSQDQADHQTMTHDGSDGSDAGDRLDQVGYDWRSYGENVAWNQKTPAAVMDAWMNSPGHRRNILNCSFTEIGVGIASSNGPYWTQDFGTPA